MEKTQINFWPIIQYKTILPQKTKTEELSQTGDEGGITNIHSTGSQIGSSDR